MIGLLLAVNLTFESALKIVVAAESASKNVLDLQHKSSVQAYISASCSKRGNLIMGTREKQVNKKQPQNVTDAVEKNTKSMSADLRRANVICVGK